LGLDSSIFNVNVQRSALFCPNGGFVPVFSGERSFVINQLGGFVFQKAVSYQLSAVSHQFAPPPAFPSTAFCLLPPTAFCPKTAAKTVASFLFFSKPDPLLSINSVASFFKKLSAISYQPSEKVEPLKVQGRKSQKAGSWVWTLRHSTFSPFLPKRWLRSCLFRGPILCYQSTRWLRFSKKALNYQAASHEFAPTASCRPTTANRQPPSTPNLPPNGGWRLIAESFLPYTHKY